MNIENKFEIDQTVYFLGDKGDFQRDYVLNIISHTGKFGEDNKEHTSLTYRLSDNVIRAEGDLFGSLSALVEHCINKFNQLKRYMPIRVVPIDELVEAAKTTRIDVTQVGDEYQKHMDIVGFPSNRANYGNMLDNKTIDRMNGD